MGADGVQDLPAQASCDSVTGHYSLETFPGRDLAGSRARLGLLPHPPLGTLHLGSQPFPRASYVERGVVPMLGTLPDPQTS